MTLRGTGVSARVHLTYNVLQCGEVFVTSSNNYEIELCNTGDIPAVYDVFTSGSSVSSRFSFEPAHGVVDIASKHILMASFQPDVLGDFSEEFDVLLQGSVKPLKLTIKGTVVCPTYTLDRKDITLGRVSVGFLSTSHLSVANTSDVPIKFNFRIPGDGSLIHKEFDVVPASGTISPGAKQRVQVDFIPSAPRTYNMGLHFDIDHVGPSVSVISIVAEAIVPKVSLSVDELVYGECFLRYSYQKILELVNHSDLPAKYELISQVISAAYYDLFARTMFHAVLQRMMSIIRKAQSPHIRRRCCQCRSPRTDSAICVCQCSYG